MPLAESAVRVEAAPVLRCKAHPEHAQKRTPVKDLLQLPEIAGDRPAGQSLIDQIIDSPRSRATQALKSERGWRDLKFVFPAALSLTGQSVTYISWDANENRFTPKTGVIGNGFVWQKNFRTVHMGSI